MAADDLLFMRTGDETGPFVLVRLLGGTPNPRAEAALSGGAAGEEAGFQASGDLASVLRDAQEHALLQGLDLRIELDGHSWPEDLGILGNVDRDAR